MLALGMRMVACFLVFCCYSSFILGVFGGPVRLFTQSPSTTPQGDYDPLYPLLQAELSPRSAYSRAGSSFSYSNNPPVGMTRLPLSNSLHSHASAFSPSTSPPASTRGQVLAHLRSLYKEYYAYASDWRQDALVSLLRRTLELHNERGQSLSLYYLELLQLSVAAIAILIDEGSGTREQYIHLIQQGLRASPAAVYALHLLVEGVGSAPTPLYLPTTMGSVFDRQTTTFNRLWHDIDILHRDRQALSKSDVKQIRVHLNTMYGLIAKYEDGATLTRPRQSDHQSTMSPLPWRNALTACGIPCFSGAGCCGDDGFKPIKFEK